MNKIIHNLVPDASGKYQGRCFGRIKHKIGKYLNVFFPILQVKDIKSKCNFFFCSKS